MTEKNELKDTRYVTASNQTLPDCFVTMVRCIYRYYNLNSILYSQASAGWPYWYRYICDQCKNNIRCPSHNMPWIDYFNIKYKTIYKGCGNTESKEKLVSQVDLALNNSYPIAITHLAATGAHPPLSDTV